MSITSEEYKTYLAKLEQLSEQDKLVSQHKQLPARIENFKSIIEENKQTLSYFSGIEGELLQGLKENTSLAILEENVQAQLPVLKELEAKIIKTKKAKVLSKKDRKKINDLIKEISIYLKLNTAGEYKNKLNQLIKSINKKQERFTSLIIKIILITAVGAVAVVFISTYWYIILGVVVLATLFWIWRTVAKTDTQQSKEKKEIEKIN